MRLRFAYGVGPPAWFTRSPTVAPRSSSYSPGSSIAPVMETVTRSIGTTTRSFIHRGADAAWTGSRAGSKPLWVAEQVLAACQGIEAPVIARAATSRQFPLQRTLTTLGVACHLALDPGRKPPVAPSPSLGEDLGSQAPIDSIRITGVSCFLRRNLLYCPLSEARAPARAFVCLEAECDVFCLS